MVAGDISLLSKHSAIIIIRWLATAVVQRPELETNRSVFSVPPPPLEQFSATFENFN